MAPQLNQFELDMIMQSKGKTVTEILAAVSKARVRKGVDPPGIDAIRRATRGKTHRRGRSETRGRKRGWSTAQTRRVNEVRKQVITKAKGEEEIHWHQIMVKARVPIVHGTTAARSIERIGLPKVCALKPREKPLRTEEHEKEREKLGKTLQNKSPEFFHKLLIIDNKKWNIPRSAMAKRFARMRKVRFHLRTRSEGLQPGFTKPSAKKNQVNPGGSAKVCAGIANGRIVLWHYLPARWNGHAAVDLYRGPIIRALRRSFGEKRSYTIMEDNDPTGYAHAFVIGSFSTTCAGHLRVISNVCVQASASSAACRMRACHMLFTWNMSHEQSIQCVL